VVVGVGKMGETNVVLWEPNPETDQRAGLEPNHGMIVRMAVLHDPKIPDSRNAPGGTCIAFEKLDGTNMHFDWDREFGWHAFGTRRDTFALTPIGTAQFAQKHNHLSAAPHVFEGTLANTLEPIFAQPFYASHNSLKIFAEFLGDHSFAGLHKPEDPKRLVLFDVWLDGYGWVSPAQFVEDFGHLPTPCVVYKGKYNGQLGEDVRNGKFGVAEGVVVKGGKGGSDVWMAKIKTSAYLQRLKAAFADNWEAYWE
jgi:hypothetical protein